MVAIIPVATGVLRAELMQMFQGSEELFITFAARVRSKAETCAFTTLSVCKCGANNTVNYTDESIRDVLIAAIADMDISGLIIPITALE